MKTLFALLLVLFVTLGAEELTVRSDSWLPFNGDPNDSGKGYIIDVMRAIFEPQGITIDYKLMPWNRSVIAVENGEINAVVGAYAEDVKGFILPKEAVDYSSEAFFKLVGNPWEFNGINSLESQSLGYMLDYATNPELITYFEKTQGSTKVQLIGGDNPLETNIKKLLAGRVTLILDNYSVVKYKLKEMNIGSDKIVFAGYFDKEKRPMYVAFSPKHANSKKYAEIFDKGFRELKANGKVNEIRKSYGMDPLK